MTSPSTMPGGNGAWRVLSIEDNAGGDATPARELLRDAPAIDVQSVDRLGLALDRLKQERYDAVLLDLSLPDSQGLETLSKVRESASAPCIVLGGKDDDQLALEAVAAGAEDYLIKGRMSGASMARCIRHSIERRRAARRQRRDIPKLGKILGFIGAKGGAGATTVALNVAAVLSQTPKRTIAVEFRPDYGGFAAQLQRSPARSARRLFELEPEQIGPRELAPYLVDLAFGAQALFGPQRIEEYGEIPPEHGEALLRAAAEASEFVVVDLAPGASAANRAAARACDYITLVLERDAASAAAARLTRNLLASWGVAEALVGAVLVNRSPAASSLSLAELRAQVGCPIICVVPNAGEISAASQRTGVPFAASHRDLAASQNLAELATRLAAAKVEALAP